jgi:hypothetical protein
VFVHFYGTGELGGGGCMLWACLRFARSRPPIALACSAG